MNIKIRQAEDNDAQHIAEIYSFESVMEQTSQLPYMSTEFWKGFYSSKGAGNIELVAICDDKAVGHLGILLNQNPRRKHACSFGIAIHPDYQGKGVGKTLMNEMIKLADNWLNLLKIELAVFADNKVAIKLYKKLGFVIEGESKYDVFKQGKYCSGYKMARYNPNYPLPD